jgi:hypothetical protein
VALEVHFCFKNCWNVRFFGGLANVCCIVHSFFGYVVEKESVCFSFVSRLQQIGLSNCH